MKRAVDRLPPTYDVAVIGAGVSGCFIARELARYKLDIVVIEKAHDVCSGASKGNGGTIHSGVNTTPGTLKARLCVAGNAVYPRIARELSVPLRTTGSLIVALNDRQRARLRQLLSDGRANKVPGCRLIGPREIRKLEPNVRAVAAVYAPTLRIICPHRLVFALADNAYENGVTFLLGCEAVGIRVRRGRVAGVETNRGLVRARFVVNAAGVHADEIARMAGVSGVEIIPRKGEYYVLDKSFQFVKRNVFPVPGKASKGTCVFPTVDGNNLVGPNSDIVEDKEDTSTSADVRRRIFRLARRMVPAVSEGHIIAAFGGVRPCSSTGDFIIEHTETEGFINVAGIQSPGLTAAPAIAEMVVNLVGEKTDLVRRKDFDPARRRPKRFAECTPRERDALISRDRRHAHIICRCETVTEKEVVDAIHLGIGARSVDAVKFRTRAGMGRCQGGFCRSRVAAILARELGIPLEDVTLRGGESKLFVGAAKELRRGR